LKGTHQRSGALLLCALQSHDDDSVMGARQETAHIGKVLIACDKNRMTLLRLIEHSIIIGTPQANFSHAFCQIAGAP
jgi:hypothetical protein